MKFGLLAIVVCLAALGSCTSPPVINSKVAVSECDQRLAHAFAEHESDFQVEGAGTVTRLLSDDNGGSRHQRFIVALKTGQTLLIAHNIDLAHELSHSKLATK